MSTATAERPVTTTRPPAAPAPEPNAPPVYGVNPFQHFYPSPETELPTTVGFEIEVNTPSTSYRGPSTQPWCEGFPHLTWLRNNGWSSGVEHCGFEFRSPVCRTWGQLLNAIRILDVLRANRLTTFAQCGVHVHLGWAGLAKHDPDWSHLTRDDAKGLLNLHHKKWHGILPAHRRNNEYCTFPLRAWNDAVKDAFRLDYLKRRFSPKGGVPSQFHARAEAMISVVDRYQIPAETWKATGWSGSPPADWGVRATYPSSYNRRSYAALLFDCLVRADMLSDFANRPTPPAFAALISPAPSADPSSCVDYSPLQYDRESGSWVRLNKHNTLEFRCFPASSSRVDLTGHILTTLMFAEHWKHAPTANLVDMLSIAGMPGTKVETKTQDSCVARSRLADWLHLRHRNANWGIPETPNDYYDPS